MSGRPVNLNKYRKRRARDEAVTKADVNAVKFGRSKAEKTRDSATAAGDAARLDGHKLDRDQ